MTNPIVTDQHVAATGYFLCVVALLFIEGLVHLPAYIRSVFSKNAPLRNCYCPCGHNRFLVFFHKLLLYPLSFSVVTDHRVSGLVRFLCFAGLNVLWGWNRILYTTDYTLYGWLTLANAGLALLLAARSNLLSLVIRVPSATLLAYHRWVGLAAVVHATLHFALTAGHYLPQGQFGDLLANGYVQAGLVAWGSLALILLSSLPPVRRRFYEVFYYSHFLFLVFFAAAIVHTSNAIMFLAPGLLLWAVDRAIRLTRSFRRVEVVSAEHYEGGVTKLRVQGLRTRRPGQVAWVQIPGLSRVNWHPFTVASAPDDDTATFAIRGLGGYTRRLQDLALEAASAPANEVGPTKLDLQICLDGPYGVGATEWDQYPVVALVAGGIGITPAISIATTLVRASLTPEAVARAGATQRHVRLLWVVKESRHAAWFADELRTLAALAGPGAPVTFSADVYASAAWARVASGEEVGIGAAGVGGGGPGLAVRPGRPDVGAWFAALREAHPGADVAANLCGPRPLIAEARRAAGRACGADGLVFVEEEVFEF